MEKSIVNISMRNNNKFNCSYAIITKEKNKVKKSTIIILKDLECGVFDYDNLKKNDNFKFLLLKHYSNEDFALKDFYKIIGKLCHKTIDSKYFLNPKEEYNRIKFNDFQNETMNFDEEELFARYNAFKEFVENIKNKI